MTRTVLVNALPTRPGGAAIVLAALLAGARTIDHGFRLMAVTNDEHVDRLLRDANPDAEIHRIQPKSGIGSFLAEANAIEELLGPDGDRILVTQNRLTRGHDGLQAVIHINLSRFQPGTGARGWRQRPAEYVRNRTAKESLMKADANIFESAYLHEAAMVRYPGLAIRNPSVAYAGLETGWSLPPDAVIEPYENRSHRLLAVTSPNIHKDNDVLIKTLAELNRTEPGRWTLAIAGGRSPDVWEPQMTLAESLGVRQHIELLGFMQRPELAKELDRVAALISSSRVESFAMVPLEAMARGVPAVVTDEASMPESVGDAGIMVSAGRPDQFAEAVRGLHQDKTVWQAKSRDSRQWAGRMTWEDFARDVMATVNKIAG